MGFIIVGALTLCSLSWCRNCFLRDSLGLLGWLSLTKTQRWEDRSGSKWKHVPDLTGMWDMDGKQDLKCSESDDHLF